MSLPLKWEFPGGKIDPGESPEECLVRELREELRILVRLEQKLPISTHHYPSVTVTLHPFVCTMATGHPNPQEHDTITWYDPEELRSLDWAAADVPVLATYLVRRRQLLPLWTGRAVNFVTSGSGWPFFHSPRGKSGISHGLNC